MTEQWGAPLTGAQMKLLRAAGLPDGTKVMFLGASFRAEDCNFSAPEPCRLPIDHPAYTLAKAGWLDGRNVALWFGGDKAPDDWDWLTNVLLRNGSAVRAVGYERWRHDGDEGDIIAYTRKAEYHEETVNACQSFDETVTIAKMTEAEARKWVDENTFGLSYSDAVNCMSQLGLIKPEPTRLERFWSTRDTKDVYGPPCRAFQLIEEALNFEK